VSPIVGELIVRGEDTPTNVIGQKDPVNLYRDGLVVCFLVGCFSFWFRIFT